MKVTDKEAPILIALADAGGYEGFCYLSFAGLIEETGLDRKAVRRACRSLARKGFAEFGRGLWNEDGEPAGSGYAATTAGAEAAKDLPRKCESCGKNPADLPSRVCVGCHAYQEHQR